MGPHTRAVNFLRRHKPQLFVLGVVLTLGVALPFSSAHAAFGFIGDIFAGAIGTISNILLLIPAFALMLIQMVLGFLAILAGVLMDQILQFSLAVPYIPSNDPSAKFLLASWSIMRDLANMLLIVVIALVGINAILGRESEKLTARIFTFVGIALLINFTPVITGVIIDLSNVLTKLFFDNVAGGWKLFAISTQGFGSLGEFVSFDIAKGINVMIAALVGAIFNILITGAFLLVSFLLIARIAALWILVIISPVAFVGYILPITAGWFSGWWKNFWQWAIIGIPLGVFLYLGTSLAASGNAVCKQFDSQGVTSQLQQVPGVSEIVQGSPYLSNICGTVVLFMALMILFAGFIITFKFSATGSGMIMKQAQNAWGGMKKWSKPAAGFAGRVYLRNLRRAGGAAAGAAGRAGGAAWGRAAGTQAGKAAGAWAGAKFAPIKERAQKGAEFIRKKTAPVRKVAKETLTPEERKAAGEVFREKVLRRPTKKDLKALIDKYKDYSKEELEETIKKEMGARKRAAQILLGKKDPKKFEESYYAKDEREGRRILEDAAVSGDAKDIFNANPKLAHKFGQIIGKSTAEIIRELTRKQLDALAETALKDGSVVSALLQHPEFDSFLRDLVKKFEHKKIGALEEGMRGALVLPGGGTPSTPEEFRAVLDKMSRSPGISPEARENLQKLVPMLRRAEALPYMQGVGFLAQHAKLQSMTANEVARRIKDISRLAAAQNHRLEAEKNRIQLLLQSKVGKYHQAVKSAEERVLALEKALQSLMSQQAALLETQKETKKQQAIKNLASALGQVQPPQSSGPSQNPPPAAGTNP